MSALAELHCCNYFTGGADSYTFHIVDFIETSLAEGVQVLVELIEEVLSDIYGGELLCSAANEDGEEFCIRERFHTIHLKFLTWAIFGSPLSDSHLHGICRVCL